MRRTAPRLRTMGAQIVPIATNHVASSREGFSTCLTVTIQDIREAGACRSAA